MVIYIKKFLGKLFNNSSKIRKEWKDIEYFDEIWKERIMLMSKFISPNSSVIDLGCGQMWVKDYLPDNCSYLGVDYVKRGDDSLICDFNKLEFPIIKSDFAFVSGCFEYVEESKWFVGKIAENFNSCIVSYCSLEFFPDKEIRRLRTWKNDYTKSEFLNLFFLKGFELIAEDITSTNNLIFYFKKI